MKKYKYHIIYACIGFILGLVLFGFRIFWKTYYYFIFPFAYIYDNYFIIISQYLLYGLFLSFPKDKWLKAGVACVILDIHIILYVLFLRNVPVIF